MSAMLPQPLEATDLSSLKTFVVISLSKKLRGIELAMLRELDSPAMISPATGNPATSSPATRSPATSTSTSALDRFFEAAAAAGELGDGSPAAAEAAVADLAVREAVDRAASDWRAIFRGLSDADGKRLAKDGAKLLTAEQRQANRSLTYGEVLLSAGAAWRGSVRHRAYAPHQRAAVLALLCWRSAPPL